MRIDLPSWLTLFFVWEWGVRLLALLFIPRNRKPSSATSWLMLIMLAPTIGLIAFLFLGSTRLSKKRRRMQVVMNKVIEDAVTEAMSTPSLAEYVHFEVPKRYQPFVNLNAVLGRLPAFSGNKLELMTHYQRSIDSITADVQQAKHFIHIEFFIITYDGETEALFVAMANAVKRGVKVRVLLDAVGSRRYPNHKITKAKLTEIGVDWHLMLPIKLPGRSYNRPDLRNHRKIVVIDGKIGYTGSQNLIRRDYHRKDDLVYDELMVRITGPVVAQLHGIFITDWYSESEELLTRESHTEIKLTLNPAGQTLAQILPSGPGYNNENNLKLFNSLIYAATKKIVIVNPYFIPDESLLVAVTSAAQRGVDVVIVNSEIMDQKAVGYAQRSYYETLLNAGVRIFLYKRPVLLHSKFITIDDDIAVIGSSNLDIRSFQLDLEVSLMVYDSSVVSQLITITESNIKDSNTLDAERWKARGIYRHIKENLARLTASLQ